MTQPIAVPAFTDNYIWLVPTDAGPLVVDPGEAGPALEALGTHRPAAILLTHHHPDHIGGVSELLDQWPDVPVFAPADDRVPFPTHTVGGGDHATGNGWSFKVIAVPGHTLSHVAYAGHGLLFCGDTLFSLGCGRLFEGTPAQMLDSLDRLSALPDDLQVCCGHEYTVANARFARTVDPHGAALAGREAEAIAQRASNRPTLPTRLASERATNPFLRVDAPGIRASIAERLGRQPVDRVEAFATLREWKDGFTA